MNDPAVVLSCNFTARNQILVYSDEEADHSAIEHQLLQCPLPGKLIYLYVRRKHSPKPPRSQIELRIDPFLSIADIKMLVRQYSIYFNDAEITTALNDALHAAIDSPTDLLEHQIYVFVLTVL